ncbi:unnamed protein product [Acanthoscelides obtectus]|uniref:Uncharacterized protein n=1 Tax=Acanthoscelides obtectus TaxID=200917 RepID=A0A9P0MBP4_ACAOB|nr:unnamed protein product [Acanthoscelides obtectus]CAK1627269.1 hypothetical protein AOBTE_LOCUS4458 [Acanthoscelides obtectus]
MINIQKFIFQFIVPIILYRSTSLADRGPDSAEQLNEDELVVALIEKDGVSRNATCWHTVYLRSMIVCTGLRIFRICPPPGKFALQIVLEASNIS